MKNSVLLAVLMVAAVLLAPLASAGAHPGAAPIRLSAPSWTATSICGATTSGGVVLPGPSCSPNPPDPQAQEAMGAGSPDTGQFVFWATGAGACTACQVTWEYDNSTVKWVNDTTATGAVHPAPAFGPSGAAICMTWDPVGGYFLAVAGAATGFGNAWTWKFSDHVWTNASAPLPGGSGSSCEMAWDYASSTAVLYTQNAAIKVGLTDLWSGTAWTNVTAASDTSAMGCLGANVMATDRPGSGVVSVGGMSCTTSAAGHWTWLYSGGVWTNVTTTAGTPTGVINPYGDEIAGLSSGVFLMTGGANTSSPPQFWELDGTWALLSVSGASGVCQRQDGLMGPIGGSEAFLFGGEPESFTTVGGSCPAGESSGTYNDSWTFAAPSQPPPPANGSGGGPIPFECGSVVLSWTNGPTPAGTTLVNVTVYIYEGTTNASSPVQIISTNGAASSLQVNGLRCATRYVFQVRDWYSGGVSGPLSGIFAFSTDGKLASHPTTCLSCTPVANWFPWLLLLVVVVAVGTAAVLLSRGKGGGGRRVGG